MALEESIPAALVALSAPAVNSNTAIENLARRLVHFCTPFVEIVLQETRGIDVAAQQSRAKAHHSLGPIFESFSEARVFSLRSPQPGSQKLAP